MQINTNVSSLIAQNSLTNTQNAMQSALAQLSSGYRINQASDDAAGYAIAQKMTGQVNGLNQASQNAQNAISLTQTAQGALNQTENILQRMRVLAVQSASDTATNSDRQQIQLETNQLASEISRISNTTEFNTKNLLSGAFKNQVFQIGANAGQNLSLSIGAMDAASLGVATDSGVAISGTPTTGLGLTAANALSITSASPIAMGTYSLTATEARGSLSSISSVGTGMTLAATNGVSLTTSSTLATGTYKLVEKTSSSGLTATFALENSAGTVVANSGSVSKATLSAGTSAITFTATQPGFTGVSLTIKGTIGGAGTSGHSSTISFSENTANTLSFSLKDATGTTVDSQSSVALQAAAQSFTMSYSGLTVNLAANKNGDVGSAATTNTNFGATGITLVATSTSQKAVVGANGLVTTGATVASGILMDTQSRANTAITAISNAINTVATQLASLGAVQNRLTDTVSSLGVTSQNMQAAEGNIKNVDMAAEMSTFTQDQVLSQAGVAMLAQANQVPQMILKLLG